MVAKELSNIYIGNKTLCDICSEQDQQHGRRHKPKATSEEDVETQNDGTKSLFCRLGIQIFFFA